MIGSNMQNPPVNMNSEMEMTNEHELNETSSTTAAAAEIENSSCVNCCQAVMTKSSSFVDLTLDSDKISSALSKIYKLHYLTAFMDSFSSSWNWTVDAKLCDDCSTVFSSLWDLYENFNQLRNLESSLAKEIHKLDDCIHTQENKRRPKEQQVKTSQVHHRHHDTKNLQDTNDLCDDDDDDDPLINYHCIGDLNASKSDKLPSSGPWLVLPRLENDPTAQNSIANLSAKTRSRLKRVSSKKSGVSPPKIRRLKAKVSTRVEDTSDSDYSEQSDEKEEDSYPKSRSKKRTTEKRKMNLKSRDKKQKPNQVKKKRKNLKVNEESNSSSVDNQSEDSDSDSTSESEKETKKVPKKKVAVTKSTKKRKVRRDFMTDPKVGDEIYEIGGKWRYERKEDDDGKVTFYCLSCNYSSPKRYMVVYHINNRHNKVGLNRFRTLKLDDNNYVYDGIYRVERVTEPNGIFYKCVTCGALRLTYALIKAHLKLAHIGGEKLVCDQCGYSCTEKVRFKFHMATHTDGKKFICEDCGKQFKSQASLRSHMECHSGKDFLCGCGKNFSYKRSLYLHRKKYGHFAPPEVQLTPEVFQVTKACPLCKREFATDEKFQKHVVSCKVNEKVTCDWCGRDYSSRCIDLHKQRFCKERFNRQKSREDENKDTGDPA